MGWPARLRDRRSSSTGWLVSKPAAVNASAGERRVSGLWGASGFWRASGFCRALARAESEPVAAFSSGGRCASCSCRVSLGWPAYIITMPDRNQMKNSTHMPTPSQRWVSMNQRLMREVFSKVSACACGGIFRQSDCLWNCGWRRCAARRGWLWRCCGSVRRRCRCWRCPWCCCG